MPTKSSDYGDKKQMKIQILADIHFEFMKDEGENFFKEEQMANLNHNLRELDK